ncbi:MAG: 16S rRNA (adenine(1518)-N(6)/adenine(1519)-N(6))-dimethyltransferase, partial [Acidimicrobiia bacterium]|nr:16S rRNA (adenine(1518)-N(6)/adenine(1519)-N(6))-dimethyltransferase [Acidimicrobiia bacterium]
MKAQSRAEILRLLETHGLQPRKALGQHFLADPNIVDKIIGAAGLTPDSRVVEIGAGTGTLTRGLAAAAGRVVAYEVDPRLRPV